MGGLHGRFVVTITRFDRVRYLGGVTDGPGRVELRPVRAREEAYRFLTRTEAERALRAVEAQIGAENLLANVAMAVVDTAKDGGER